MLCCIQLVAETGVLPILVSLCKGPKQLRLDEKRAKQKLEADAKAEKERAMGEDEDPGLEGMFQVPAIEEVAEDPADITGTDRTALKVSIQLSEHNGEYWLGASTWADCYDGVWSHHEHEFR